MPKLTRRRDPDREECWRVYYGDVHAGTISECVGNTGAAPKWNGAAASIRAASRATADTFDEARAALEAPWRVFLV